MPERSLMEPSTRAFGNDTAPARVALSEKSRHRRAGYVHRQVMNNHVDTAGEDNTKPETRMNHDHDDDADLFR